MISNEYHHTPINSITLGTKVEWAPYHLDSPDGPMGLAVSAVSCVMNKLNQPYTITQLPWSRAQYLTESAQLDGFFSASKNKVRDTYATLSTPFIPQTRAFYLLKSNHDFYAETITIDFIKNNLSIGARVNSNALFSIQQKGFSIAITPQRHNQLLRALQLKRMDAVLENTLVFEDLIKNHDLDLSDFHKIVYQEKPMGVYFSNVFLNQNPGFLSVFNEFTYECRITNDRESSEITFGVP